MLDFWNYWNCSIPFETVGLYLTQREKDLASERAEKLQDEYCELYKDHEMLRTSLNADLQRKV